jgi:hypothetical protein
MAFSLITRCITVGLHSKHKSHLLRRSITIFNAKYPNPVKLEASGSEHGNEALGPVKIEEFLDELRNFGS